MYEQQQFVWALCEAVTFTLTRFHLISSLHGAAFHFIRYVYSTNTCLSVYLLLCRPNSNASVLKICPITAELRLLFKRDVISDYSHFSAGVYFFHCWPLATSNYAMQHHTLSSICLHIFNNAVDRLHCVPMTLFAHLSRALIVLLRQEFKSNWHYEICIQLIGIVLSVVCFGHFAASPCSWSWWFSPAVCGT